MKICFIDDEVGRITLDVIIAVKDYADKKGVDVNFDLLAVAIGWGSLETEIYDYFKKKYKENDIKIIKCDTETMLKENIEGKLQEEILFMIDVQLRKDEEDNTGKIQDYKCLSMKVIDWIASKKYHLYSRLVEDEYVIWWRQQFKALYNTNEPKIIERENLQPGSFSEECADKLLRRTVNE